MRWMAVKMSVKKLFLVPLLQVLPRAHYFPCWREVASCSLFPMLCPIFFILPLQKIRNEAVSFVCPPSCFCIGSGF